MAPGHTSVSFMERFFCSKNGLVWTTFLHDRHKFRSLVWCFAANKQSSIVPCATVVVRKFFFPYKFIFTNVTARWSLANSSVKFAPLFVQVQFLILYLPWITCLHCWQVAALRKTWSWKQWVLTGCTVWPWDFGWGLKVMDSGGLMEGECDDSERLGLMEGDRDGERS